MGLVESNAALCITILKGSNTLNKYYCVFKVQIETIEAHGGNLGYYSALVQELLEAPLASKGFDTLEKQKTVAGNNLKKMKKAALKSAKSNCLGCVCLMMTDERYKPVENFLHEGFLADKHQYPWDVLAIKRFMADFIGTVAAKQKKEQQQKKVRTIR